MSICHLSFATTDGGVIPETSRLKLKLALFSKHFFTQEKQLVIFSLLHNEFDVRVLVADVFIKGQGIPFGIKQTKSVINIDDTFWRRWMKWIWMEGHNLG